MEDVAIIGVGLHPFGRFGAKSAIDMGADAVRAALADAGITHAFVNWGSDHSAFLEDLQRQRVENDGRTLVEIVTCPSEYVALSAAHGYAQVTRRPAVVIVHVDVGTQVSTVVGIEVGRL